MSEVHKLVYGPLIHRLLKEREIPPFSIKKKTIRAGTVLDYYLAEEGRVVKGKFQDDFPVVVLQEGERVWMSNGPFEFAALVPAVEAARGKVLTSGLGIGFFPFMARVKPGVTKIDIVERSQKVIDLVFDQIKTPKMEVIQDELYHFLRTTDRRYDFIYLDIWTDMFGPIEDVDRATRAARRCLKPGGEIRVWLQELIDRVKANLPKKPTEKTASPGFLDPCLICGKCFRHDYAGLCMDCADALGVSEMFIRRRGQKP